MSEIPETRISILTAISSDADSARWAEFVRAYEKPMRGFLFSRFPSLDADDVIQDTMVALIKALPNYHYVPDERGHFRNYLMGIINNRARDLLRRRAREHRKLDEFGKSLCGGVADRDEAEEQAFRESLLNAALDQLLNDSAINPTHREIFRHVILLHEPPAEVAELFGVTRNNVDQIRNRLRSRLAETVRAMELSDREA